MTVDKKKATTQLYGVEQLLDATKDLTGYNREVGEAALIGNTKKEMTVEDYRGLISALLSREVK